MGKNKQKAAPDKHKSKKKQKISPRRNNRMIYLNLAATAFRKIKARRKLERQKQSRKGLGSNLVKMGFDLGSKAIDSKFGKKLINKGTDNIPNIFKFGVSKIKNKNVKKALGSEIADMVVDEAQNRAKNRYTSLFH